MTWIVERLAELRRHVEHLRDLRPRVETADSLRRNLTLHNDVLYSLLSVCQLVIDIAGELSAQRGLPFEDYTEAVRNLAVFDELPDDLVAQLVPLPGFRNVLVHEYAALDLERAVEAMDRLEPVAELVRRVAALLEKEQAGGAAEGPEG